MDDVAISRHFTKFSSLPIELKLYLGEFFFARDHFRYASTCRELWDLSRTLVAANKRMIMYSYVGLDQDSESNNVRLRELYNDPSLLDIVTTVVLGDVNNYLDLRRHLDDTGSLRPILDHMELNDILQKAIQTSNRQALFDRAKDYRMPKAFFPIFTPNVEIIGLISRDSISQFWRTVCTLVSPVLHLSFPRLSHIRINPKPREEYCASFRDLKVLAQLPTLRCIRCTKNNCREDDSYDSGPLELKEIELIQAWNPTEDQLRKFFGLTTALERLHFTHENGYGGFAHIPRVIINALLERASQTLKILLLDDQFEYVNQIQPSCLPLTGFACLKVFRCSWRDLVPGLQQVASEHPEIADECSELDAYLYQEHANIVRDRVFEMFDQVSKYIKPLEKMLPSTLKNLTLRRCVRYELSLLKSYVGSDACQLETLYFDLTNAVDIAGNEETKPIVNSIIARGMRYEDGCRSYADKSAPKSWAYY